MSESFGDISLQVSIDSASAIKDAVTVGTQAGNQISKSLQDALAKGGVASGNAARKGIESELSKVKSVDLDITASSLSKIQSDLDNFYRLSSKPVYINVQILGLDGVQKQLDSLASKKVTLRTNADTKELESSISRAIHEGFKSGSKNGLASLAVSFASSTIALPANIAKNIAGGLVFGITNEVSKNLASGLTQALDRGLSKSFGSTQLIGDKLGVLLGNSLQKAFGEGLDNLPDTLSKAIQGIGDKIPAISGITGKLGKEVKLGLQEDIKEFKQASKDVKDAIQQAIGSEDIAREGLYVRGSQRKQSQQKLQVSQGQGVQEWREDLRNNSDLANRYVNTGAMVNEKLPELSESLKASKIERANIIKRVSELRQLGNADPQEVERLKLAYAEVSQQITDAKKSITDLAQFSPTRVANLETKKSDITEKIEKLSVEAEQIRKSPNQSDTQFTQSGNIAAEIALLEQKIKNVDAKLQVYKDPINESKAQVAKSYQNLQAVTPEIQPKAYMDIVREVFGKDLKENKLPQLVSDRNLKGNGQYNAGLNRISVTPEIYSAIINDTLSTLQSTTLAHELVHGKQSDLGSFEGLQAAKQNRSLTPLKQATPEFMKANGDWLAQYNNPGVRALEVDAEMRGSQSANSFMSGRVNDKAMNLKLQAVKSFDSFFDKTLKSNKLAIDELSSKISEGESTGVDVSRYQNILEGLRQKNKDIAIFLNKSKHQLLDTAIPDESTLKNTEDYTSGVAESAANQAGVIKKNLVKLESLFQADVIENLKTKREDTTASLGTLNRKKELDPLAQEFGIETKGLNKKQVVENLSQVDDIVSLSARTNEITRAKAQKQLQRREQLQDVAEMAGTGARTVVGAGQSVMSSGVAQKVFSAGKDSISALGEVTKVGYGILKGAEDFALDVIPMGRTLKGIGQHAVIPAALFSTATHLLPGGGAIAEGLGSLTHGVANPMISGASEALSGGAAGFISNAIPNVMGIQAHVSGAVSGLITEGVSAAGELFVNSATMIFGGKAIQATVGRAIPKIESKPTALALPQAREKELVELNQIEPVNQKRLASTAKPATTALLAPIDLVETVEKATEVAALAVVDQAKLIGSRIRSLYADFTKAKKSGDEGLATSLAQSVKDYSAKYKESMAQARASLGDDAKFGSTIGNQLASQEGQVTKSQKVAERYLSVRENMKSADPAMGQDLNLHQLNKNEISALTPEQLKAIKEADSLLESLNQKLINFNKTASQSTSKSNKILNTPDVEGQFNHLEAGVEIEKMKGITLKNLTQEQSNQLAKMEAQVANAKPLKPLEKEATEAESIFDKFSNTLGFTVKAGLGLGALVFVAPLLSGFAKSSIDAAMAMEVLAVKMSFAEGSTKKAAESLSYAKDLAKELGSNQNASISGYANLSASTKDSNLEGEATKQIFKGFSEGAAARQLSKDDMKGVMLAVQQMADKGVISEQELRGQMSQRFAGTMTVAARSRGQTVQAMNRDIKTGSVTAEDFLPKFAQQLSAESALSLPTAMESSTAVANRFDNAIEDVQVTIGRGLSPAWNLGLKAITAGLETLIAISPMLVNLGGTLAASWGFGLAKSFIASGLGAKLLSVNLSGIGDAALKALPGLIKISTQFLLFTAAIEVFKSVASVIADASGEMKGFADAAEKGNAKVKELDDNFRNKDKPKAKSSDELPQTALVDGTFLSGLAKSVNPDSSLGDKIGYGVRFGIGGAERLAQKALKYTPAGVLINAAGGDAGATYDDKQNNDKLVSSERISTASASLTNKMQNDLNDSSSAINTLIKANVELDQLMEKERSLTALNPNDKEGLKALKDQESQMRKNIEVAGLSTGASSKQNETNIESLKAQIAEFEKLASEPGAKQDQYAGSIRALKDELKAAESVQIKFNAALSQGIDSFTLFTIKFSNVIAELADGTEKIKLAATVSKTELFKDQMSGGLTSQQVSIASASIDNKALQTQIDNTADSIGKLANLLESQASTIKAYGVTPDMGKEQIKTLSDKASNPKDKKVLEDYSKLQELQNQQVQLSEQLASSQAQASQQIRDTTKSIGSFFKGILDQTNLITIETKQSQNKVAMLKAETKLRSALLGFQDTFATTYVDGLIGFLQTLNKPLEDALTAQTQLLNNQTSLRATQQQILDSRGQIEKSQSGQGDSASYGTGSTVSTGAYKIFDSNDSHEVAGYQDLTRHHANRGQESGRDYGVVGGREEEIRQTSDGRTLVKKDMVLEKGGSTNVAVPSPSSGYAQRLGDVTNGVRIYADAGFTQLLSQVLHMKDLKVNTGDKVSYGQALGIQGDSGSPGAIHAHVEATVEVLRKFVSDLETGTFTDGSKPSNQSSSNSTNSSGTGFSSIGGADPAKIKEAVDYYLAQGLSKQGAAYLTGSLIQESRLDPQAVGDGGSAKGLAQWHPDRRQNMPSDYKGQLAFALREMQNDSPDSLATLKNPNASASQNARAVKNWERYGEEGNRYQFAEQIHSQIKGATNGQSSVSQDVHGNSVNAGMLDTADSQALANNKQQASNIQSQLAANGQLDALKAEQQIQRTQRQFAIGLDDSRYGVIQHERSAEDKSDTLGFSTPQKQKRIEDRNVNREFFDANKELFKQLDDLRSANGTLKASLAVINKGGFQGADKLKSQVPMIETGIKQTDASIQRVEALLDKAATYKNKKLADIKEKADIAESKRVADVKSQLATLMDTKQKSDADLAALVGSPGKDLIGDRSNSEIAAKKATFEVEKKTLDEQLRTGQLVKSEYEAILKLKTDILDKDIRTNALIAEREKQTLKREVANKLFDSGSNVTTAKADYLTSIGKHGAADEMKKQLQIDTLGVELDNQLQQLDEYALKTNMAASSVAKLRNNLVQLNTIKLDTLKAQFNPFQQIANNFKDSLGSAFKSVLDGTRTLKEAMGDMVKNLLSKVAELAANSLLNDLFSGGKGNGGLFGGGGQTQQGGGGLGGILGSLVGGLFGGKGAASGGSPQGGIFGSVVSMFGGGFSEGGITPNYAKGNLKTLGGNRPYLSGDMFSGKNSITKALGKEGREGVVSVLKPNELVLSASQTQMFFDKRLDRELGSTVRNFADGNLSNFASSNSSTNATTINVPVTVNAASDGSKPQINVSAMQQAIRATVTEELLKNRRNGGLLSD